MPTQTEFHRICLNLLFQELKRKGINLSTFNYKILANAKKSSYSQAVRTFMGNPFSRVFLLNTTASFDPATG